MHFRFITHLSTFDVIAQLHKMKPTQWKGEPARGEPDICKSRSLLLRHHNRPDQDNWLDDLPLHDSEVLQKWVSLNKLLRDARAAVLKDPAFKTVADFSAPPGRVMLSMLTKTNAIQWHTDNGPYHKRHARFHIPLLTNPLCHIQVQAESVHMEVGALWWFNNRYQHCATNFGTTMRIHLIFEMPLLVQEDEKEE